jgi:Family of unknown function (DUF5677)
MADKINYIELKEQYVSIINEVIKIMEDMARAVPSNYSDKKIYPFRDLCLGYLLICKSNVEAALRLFENNLGDQINYINRNMFEMVVTLFYINDDNNKKDERVTRYFEYNNAILNYRTKESILKYHDSLSKKISDELNKKINQKYKDFGEKYCKKEGNKKPSKHSWSGMKISEMIESLSNQSDKEKLLKHYKIAITLNNAFLHPTITYIRIAFSEFYEHKTNYNLLTLQAVTVLHLAGYIIDIFLSQFQKGRPAFQARIEAAGNKFNQLENELNNL